MTDTKKRGGARLGAGAPRKPADQSSSIRFSLALPPAEAATYKRLGATRWLRRMLAGDAPQEQDEQKWRPISTAPRDAVLILGYAPHWRMDGHRRVFEGRWDDGQKTWTSVNGFLVHTSATHWMPLPDPPESP